MRTFYEPRHFTPASLDCGSNSNKHQEEKVINNKTKKANKVMTETDIMPPLDLDLNTVDTSMPLINGGSIADFTAVKVEKKTAKDGKTHMLAIDWKSTTPTTGVKGETLNPGVHLFDNVILAPSGKATWDMVTKNIASVTQAIGLSTNLNDFLNGGYTAIQGATARIKVGFVPEGPDKTGVFRKAKNEVGAYIKPS